MFARTLISRKACGPTRSVQHLFVWVCRKRCLRFYLISSSANHGIRAVAYRSSRHQVLSRVLSLTGLDACALEPGRRFVTERGKKKKSRNLNPGLTHWVIKSSGLTNTVQKLTTSSNATFAQPTSSTSMISEKHMCKHFTTSIPAMSESFAKALTMTLTYIFLDRSHLSYLPTVYP